MEQKVDIEVKCPECGTKMGKAGFVMINRNEKRQRYRCSKCGRTTAKAVS